MNLNKIHSIYFLGIGGIGMSALARYFKFAGKQVAGYDKTATPLTDELIASGILVHFEDNLDVIPEEFKKPENTLVVYTPAVPKDLSQLKYFQDRGFAVKKRAEVLGMVTKETFCFAVAGTHGKTTTSCILAHLLKESGMPFIAFLGGISEDFNSNFVLEGTENAVVEADEYDRSFLHLSPDIACITSMDADHLDIYGNADELKKSFVEFTKRLKPNGRLFVKNGLPIKGITFGIEDGSDFEIRNINVQQGAYRFDLRTPTETLTDVQFGKPGRHNLLNALAAFAMAAQLPVEPSLLAKALGTFKGVQRRFSYQIKQENLVFIDDYAHHPTEIEAVHSAVREMHPQKKVVTVFQPHLFSRTKDFADGFAKSLARFDVVLLLDIYPAREEPIQGITSSWLLGRIEHPNKELVNKQNLVEKIKEYEPDVLVTMGAGDIGLEVPNIKKQLLYAS
ncbi:MAG: UDP-N-acetylmuramate--L-alanine ligase [Muricauda sp.]|nr:UDP-N-acetylmuramate--L-alanine ligase [Allomuricauda sp.]MBC32085.1 UDP-N-acetylmuramate--L-alanine ligase [Allomuricauda sp.]